MRYSLTKPFPPFCNTHKTCVRVVLYSDSETKLNKKQKNALSR